MRYWLYVEPVNSKSFEPIWQVFSDRAILADYWEYWCTQMHKVNKVHEISETNCIDDWVVTHWAIPATAENLQKIIAAPNIQ